MIAMMKKRMPETPQDAKVVRDLGVVVTLVELGTIVRDSEPNYALLSKATNTIKKFLDRLYVRDVHVGAEATIVSEGFSPIDLWNMQSQLEPWDFEANFWDRLAEHPCLFDTT